MISIYNLFNLTFSKDVNEMIVDLVFLSRNMRQVHKHRAKCVASTRNEAFTADTASFTSTF